MRSIEKRSNFQKLSLSKPVQRKPLEMADDTDPMFEFFDAPKYVDFTDMGNLMEDDGADQWFDYHNEEDGEFQDSLVPPEGYPLATPAHLIDNSQESADVGSTVKQEPAEEQSNKDAPSKPEKKVPNLKQFFAKKINPSLKEKRSPRVAAKKANVNINCILNKRQSPGRPRVKKPSGDTQLPSKTTEDLQMEEIKRLQMETRKRLRQNRRSFRKLANSSGPIAVKGTKPTTQAKEFNFHTKKKDQTASTKSRAMNVADFPSTLRSSSSANTYNPNFPTKPATPDGVTKVKPFHFHLDERLNQKSVSQTQGDIPTAEAILKFEKSTPPRFRRNPTPTKKSTINTSTGSNSNSSRNLKLTMPKTPMLMAKGRSRPVTAPSAAEEEEKEVAKMKEFQFKANPLNPDIFLKGGLYGVPRKRANFQATEAHTPELATKKRCFSRKTEEQETKDERTFHANPMPNFDKIKGVPEKKVMPVTEPDTPVITAKRQCLSDGDNSREEDTTADTDHVIKANPIPDLSKVFKVELPHRILQAKPFSFEERDKEKPTRETLVQKILRNEKNPEFKAQPLPDFRERPILPPKNQLPLTKVEPFSLKTEKRGEHHSIKFQEQVKQEVKDAKEDAEFKAHKATVLYSEPFVPKKSNKPLANIDNFQLHTELRSEKRFKFDAERYRKEREIEIENLKRRALREAEEAKEIAQYRKSLVHKAQPICHYEPIVIHGSDRPVTEPISPHFLLDERLKK